MDICRNPLCGVDFEEEKSSYYSDLNYQQRKKTLFGASQTHFEEIFVKVYWCIHV